MKNNWRQAKRKIKNEGLWLRREERKQGVVGEMGRNEGEDSGGYGEKRG